MLEDWKAPTAIDSEKLKADIASLQAEVDALKSKASLSAAPPGAGSTAAPLARKASTQLNGYVPSAAPITKIHSQERSHGSGGATGTNVGLDPLLAPLPRMMPIAEMTELAMQGHNARRKEVEDRLMAERMAKEEEERLEREKLEQEREEQRRAEEEMLMQKQAEQEEEERKRKEEEERNRPPPPPVEPEETLPNNDSSMPLPPNALLPGQDLPKPSMYDGNHREGSAMENDFGDHNMQEGENGQFGMSTNTNGLGAYDHASNPDMEDYLAGDGVFGDTYNLIMNNFNSSAQQGYGSNGNGEGGDDGGLEESMFDMEYMNQMTDM